MRLVSIVVLMAFAATLLAQESITDDRLPNLDGVQNLTGGSERLTIKRTYWTVTNDKNVGDFNKPRFITKSADFSDAWKRLGFASCPPSWEPLCADGDPRLDLRAGFWADLAFDLGSCEHRRSSHPVTPGIFEQSLAF